MFESNGGDIDFEFPAAPHEPPLSIEEVVFPSIIDNSMMDDFRKCEMRWFYKHCRKLALLDENVHLVAGGAYARGLEVTRRRFFDDEWPFRAALRAGIRAAIIYYGPFEPHGRHTAKSVWRVIGAIEHHFNRWPIDSRLRPYKPEGADRHAIEFSFAEPIPGVVHPETGDPLLLSGKCDFIGIDLDAGILGPVDDKTTTSLGDYWLSKWDLSNQMYGYIWAARRAGYPASAAFIRGVSILKTKFGDADARTYATDEKLEMYIANVAATVTRMIRCYNDWKEGRGLFAKEGPGSRNLRPEHLHPFQMALGGACTDFGGCAFKTLCESDTPEIWIPVNYTRNKWNPLDSRD